MDSPFNVLSLCSGGAGLDRGIRLAVPSARVVCWVEWEAFACEVLASEMETGRLDAAPLWTNLRTFDGKPWRGVVDLLAAGYPCPPFSCAGKRKGKEDPRHLWPEVARAIAECEPRFVFLENVAGHVTLGFDEVAVSLERMGYRVEAGLFSAEEVGAPHERDRLFVLAVRDASGDELRDAAGRSVGTNGNSASIELENPARPVGRRGGRRRRVSQAVRGFLRAIRAEGLDVVPCPDNGTEIQDVDRWHVSGFDCCSTEEGLRGIVEELADADREGRSGERRQHESGDEAAQRHDVDGRDCSQLAKPSSGGQREPVESRPSGGQPQRVEPDVAHAEDAERRTGSDRVPLNASEHGRRGPGGDGAEVADTGRERRQLSPSGRQPAIEVSGADQSRRFAALAGFPPSPADLSEWSRVLAQVPEVEPALCSLAHGVANRRDQLRLLGNGVVPQCAALALLVLGRRLGVICDTPNTRTAREDK